MCSRKIDQSELKNSFDRIHDALVRRPSLGRDTFVSTTRLGKGLTFEIQEGDWRIEADMPTQAGGDGSGPTPGMLGRAALGSCLAIGYTLWASRLPGSMYSHDPSIVSGRYVSLLPSTADQDRSAHPTRRTNAN